MVHVRASRWVAAVVWFGLLATAHAADAGACARLFRDEVRHAAWAVEATVHYPASVPCTTEGAVVEQAIEQVLRAGGIVFLGEVHDNERHHRLRADLLMGLRRAGVASAGLVFEHIRDDQTDALRPPPASAEALFAALKWDDGGWPDKALFATLFEQAVGWPLYAGEPARGRVRDLARKGLGALSAEEASRLKLDVPLPAALQDGLLTELEASHCGLMPKAAFGTMAIAQRYRDAFLADAALRAAGAHGGALVFTGNGHARRDRGAPLVLRSRGFDKPVLVVLLVEATPATVDAAIADVVIATKPAERKDPCEEMRARFGKKG